MIETELTVTGWWRATVRHCTGREFTSYGATEERAIKRAVEKMERGLAGYRLDHHGQTIRAAAKGEN